MLGYDIVFVHATAFCHIGLMAAEHLVASAGLYPCLLDILYNLVCGVAAFGPHHGLSTAPTNGTPGCVYFA